MPLELELELWPRQLEAFESPAREILFGGASEGGALPRLTPGRKVNPTSFELLSLHGASRSRDCNAFSSGRNSTISLRTTSKVRQVFARYSLHLSSAAYAQSHKPVFASLTAHSSRFSIAKMSGNSHQRRALKSMCLSLMKQLRSASGSFSSSAHGAG